MRDEGGIIMDLKTLLGEDLYTQVNAALTTNPDVTILLDSKKESNYLPKARFDEVNVQRKQYKEQNDQLGKDIDALKVSAKGNEALTEKFEAMKTKLEANEVAMTGVKMDARISVALQANKAKNGKIVSSLLDRTKLSLDEDGEVVGLKEQLTKLKESDSYLFTADEVPGIPGKEEKKEEEIPGAKEKEEVLTGGTGTIGGAGGKGKEEKLSIGAMLAKQRSGAFNNNNPSKFFPQD